MKILVLSVISVIAVSAATEEGLEDGQVFVGADHFGNVHLNTTNEGTTVFVNGQSVVTQSMLEPSSNNCSCSHNGDVGDQLSQISQELKATKELVAQLQCSIVTPPAAVSTQGAYRMEYFEINNEHYLAIANSFKTVQDYRGQNTTSQILKWNIQTQKWGVIQDIPTHSAVDWEYFEINGESYLACAESQSEASVNINSRVFQWNRDAQQWVVSHSIPTNSAYHVSYFEIDSISYLGFSFRGNGSSMNINSHIFKWNSNNEDWTLSHRIPTHDARMMEYFEIGANSYLAVANAGANSDSHVLKWNRSTKQWDEHQHIATKGCTGLKYFEIASKPYIVAANSKNTQTPIWTFSSQVFAWSADAERWDVSQNITTTSATDWEYFEIDSSPYLAVANNFDGVTRNIDSKVYNWNHNIQQWELLQNIPTMGARSFKYFEVASQSYLAVSQRQNDDLNFNINSYIYKWNPCRKGFML